jgi:hypothetical protein
MIILAHALRAQIPSDIARDLARRIGPVAREAVSLEFRNLSDLRAADAADLRRWFETELRNQGARIVESSGTIEARVTIAQNLASYLLVAEVRRGDDRQVIMLPWPRTAARAIAAALSLEKTLLLEDPEQILDAASAEPSLLVLHSSRISRYVQRNGRWEPQESAALPLKAWPRDLRGRLILQNRSFLAYLPGTICSGALEPLDVRCRDADEPWPGELRAVLVANRNFFDGHVSLASGVRKSLPAFYSAAMLTEGWALAGVDGQVRLYDTALDPAGQFGGWGSDLAAVKCGSATLLLAPGTGDGSEKDSVRVFQIVDRQPVDAGAAVDMPGPVTALWPAGEVAVAVARDLVSGDYAAFRLAVVCGH